MIALLLAAVTAAHPAFAGIPHIAFVTYPVHGTDLATIRASLDAARPVDPNDGERVEAISNPRFTWQWPGGRGGDCYPGAATVRFAATVTLPRLVGIAALAPDVQVRWRRYIAALEMHEAGHVRYAYDHRGDVLAALRGATCRTAEAAGQAALRTLAEHDIAYDAETRHGQLQGATFP